MKPNNKIKLSFSSLNQTINAPHCWLARSMGLKTFTTQDFESGKRIHRIVQDHVSGVKLHDLLTNLPPFSQVEKVDFDETMKVEYPINDKYFLTGFVDGKDPERGDILEIKSGAPWSPGKFAASAQWKLYALALGEKYRKIWLVSLPKEEEGWSPLTIKIFNKDIMPIDLEEAKNFITKGIEVIENIKDAVDNEMTLKGKNGWKGRSRWCFYDECPWCEGSFDA